MNTIERHREAAKAAESDAAALRQTANTYPPGPKAEMIWAAHAMTQVREHHTRCADQLQAIEDGKENQSPAPAA